MNTAQIGFVPFLISCGLLACGGLTGDDFDGLTPAQEPNYAGQSGNGGQGGAGAPIAGNQGSPGGHGSAAAGGTGNGGAGLNAGAAGGQSPGGGGTTAVCASQQGPAMVAVPRPDGGTMCIDSTEVTRGQYKLFLESVVEGTAPQQPDYCQWNQVFEPLDSCLKQNDVCQPSQGDCDQHPVVCVDQCDAMAYCAWAGKRLCGGIKGGGVSYNNFDDVGSSQWMNACSSGETMSKPTNTYFGGTKVINCNRLGLMNCEPYGPNSVNICTTWAVGTHPGCQASAPYAGVFDLGGNVWEWEDSCQASSGETDPCRLRGGSYADSIESERCAADISAARNGYNSNVGFRCCGP